MARAATYRSYGPFRASLYAGADYAEGANETVVTMAMIETAEAQTVAVMKGEGGVIRSVN